MSNLRLPQGSGAGGDAGGHNELEEVPNIYQLLNQHPLELWKIFVAINISYNVAETNNSKDKYKYKYKIQIEFLHSAAFLPSCSAL